MTWKKIDIQDTGENIVEKINQLPIEEDLQIDSSHIKNLPKWIERKGKQMLVGGIRFLENLADVAIIPTNKRQDLLIQYNTTNNRWQDGLAITVSATQPTNPKILDLWIDIS